MGQFPGGYQSCEVLKLSNFAASRDTSVFESGSGEVPPISLGFFVVFFPCPFSKRSKKPGHNSKFPGFKRGFYSCTKTGLTWCSFGSSWAFFKKKLRPNRGERNDVKNYQSRVRMDVSKNSGTPKSSILIGFSNINHPFWDTTIFGNTRIVPTRSIFFSADSMGFPICHL